MNGKPRQAYPAMYALLYPALVEVARWHGYALALHGSLGRDMDVIAVPWTEDAADPVALMDAMVGAAGLRIGAKPDATGPMESVEKPHGRLAWSLHLAGGAYIDLSVIPPRAPTAQPSTQDEQ